MKYKQIYQIGIGRKLRLVTPGHGL